MKSGIFDDEYGKITSTINDQKEKKTVRLYFVWKNCFRFKKKYWKRNFCLKIKKHEIKKARICEFSYTFSPCFLLNIRAVHIMRVLKNVQFPSINLSVLKCSSVLMVRWERHRRVYETPVGMGQSKRKKKIGTCCLNDDIYNAYHSKTQLNEENVHHHFWQIVCSTKFQYQIAT